MARPGLRIGVATIWDPMAVTFARGAGEGAEIALRFGGKCCAEAGEPIDARVTVVRVVDEGKVRQQWQR